MNSRWTPIGFGGGFGWRHCKEADCRTTLGSHTLFGFLHECRILIRRWKRYVDLQWFQNGRMRVRLATRFWIISYEERIEFWWPLEVRMPIFEPYLSTWQKIISIYYVESWHLKGLWWLDAFHWSPFVPDLRRLIPRLVPFRNCILVLERSYILLFRIIYLCKRFFTLSIGYISRILLRKICF